MIDITPRYLAVLEAVWKAPSFASANEIALEAGMQQSDVARILKKLTEDGYVEARRIALFEEWEPASAPDPRNKLQVRIYEAITSRENTWQAELAEKAGSTRNDVSNAIRNLRDSGRIKRIEGRHTHARSLTHAGIEALIEAGRIQSDAIARPKREASPIDADRERLVRIGQQDRIALRRVLQSQFRLPYREVEATMRRLGFGSVGA